jgi:SnoaL-like polyketide cyclase
MAMLHRAFTDLHIRVEDLIADGDKVVGRTTATGTHQGEYMGLPPTCKSVAHNEIFVFRFENGQIAEIFMGSSTSARKCNSSAWSLRQRKEAYLVAEMNACCRLRAELHKSEEIQASAQNVRLDSTVVSDAIVEI